MIDKVAIMNEARKKYQVEHDAEVIQLAQVSFDKCKNESLFVAGIMLYWAEGTQLPKNGRYRKYQLALTNSNPELIELYCNFLRRYFDNIESSLRVGLFIYEDLEESEVKIFWSNRLKIPLGQFIKTQVLLSRSTLTENKLPYGTCCVYLNSKDYCYTMQNWIGTMSNIMRG